jgi:plastocyanin
MLKLLMLGATLAVATTIAVPVLAAPTAQTVRVTERDYRITLSATPRAGTVTFVVRNTGEDVHDFWVRGGGRTWKSRIVVTGGSARLTATLKRGVRYRYWCGVGSHASKGMSGSFVAR